MAALSFGSASRGFAIGCLVAGGAALAYSQLRGAGQDGVDVASAEAALPAVGAAGPNRVSALGRLEPEDGVIRIAGPSAPSVVIAKLYVDDCDRVTKGQLLATIDTVDVLEAGVKRLEAELENARHERDRTMQLFRGNAASDSSRDTWEMRVRVAEAELAGARAQLAHAYVYSPIDGQVLRVHAREGERVGPEGIVELGKTDHMFAIAEVYEEDVTRVRVGQHAVITSPALPAPLSGKVDWVHLSVAKQDAIGDDPAARKDARIVEVEVRLDDSRAAAGLTNLQVDVRIDP
jgi:HlyD family secretion protein